MYSSASIAHHRQRLYLLQKSIFRMDNVLNHERLLPAILMSQARAISRPPPNAAPSSAAMVGTGRFPAMDNKEGAHVRSGKSRERTCSPPQHRSVGPRLRLRRGKRTMWRVAVNAHQAP